MLLVLAPLAAAVQPSTEQASDYFPLTANARYEYLASYRRLGSISETKDSYIIVSKRITAAGNEIFYFIEEGDEGRSVQGLDIHMFGLGALGKGSEGFYTYDVTWNHDLKNIPPQKPHLFLRSPIVIGDSIRIPSDDRSQIYVFTVEGFERIAVPAGSYEKALKLSKRTIRADNSEEKQIAWFAKGVGLVKRVLATGRVEELVSYELGGGEFVTREIESWVGVNFVFLPIQKSFIKFGYQLIHKPGQLRVSLPYEKYVGRVAKVISITPDKYNIIVNLRLEDTKEMVVAEAYGRTINGLGPLDDIMAARAKYKGRTLWTRATLYTYNEELDKLGVISLSDYRPVKVIDVVPSWEDNAPVRFLLGTESGIEAFVDVHMTDTNISDKLRQYAKFSEVFRTRKP
ncbi:MAG TPA: hypothetical protein VM864_14975 [Pyrinomonadaceae bacterium]|nr:hypothetical protein [Pyrinomonadaceae bacterium]